MMYLVYIDESGDDGIKDRYIKCKTPTEFFIRSALIIHDKKWRRNIDTILSFLFSQKIRNNIELHATEIYKGKSGKGKKQRINFWGQKYPNKEDREEIIKKVCTLIKNLDVSIIFVAINKSKLNASLNIKEKSWELLTERVNLFLNQQKDKCGMMISDAIEHKIEKDHRDFIKTMYNNSEHINNKYFIESILFEPSESSKFLQLADIVSYSFHRKLNCDDNKYFDKLKDKIFEYQSKKIRNSGIKIWPD